MEEKNATKISLSTFLLIIAIIAIIVMGIFIYKLNNEKTIETQKSADLQAQVSSLNSTVNSLQSKINTISETVNNDNNSTNTSTTTSAIETTDANLTTYNGSEYTFKYNKNWKDLGIATKDSVGRVNRRVGALQLETENKDRVSILKHSNITLSKYIEEHKNSFLDPSKEHSEDGGFELISENSYNGNSLKGYKIVFKQMDLIYVSYLLESNNTVYEIEYPGSESNYNSLKSDLEKTVNSFKIN